jgi:hypothetical protein
MAVALGVAKAFGTPCPGDEGLDPDGWKCHVLDMFPYLSVRFSPSCRRSWKPASSDPCASFSHLP